MSAAGAALVLASYRGGSTYAPLYETFVIVPLIAAMAVGCAVIAIYLRRRYRQPKPVADEWQARAAMSELCPHGWRAQITIAGWDAPVPDDAPDSRVPLVELEWTQFADEFGQVLVTRRLWAATIDGALQAMVDDRRTDIALEQIERAAEEGDTWRSE